MRGHMNLVMLAALLAFSAGGAAADSKQDPVRPEPDSKQAAKDRPERLRHAAPASPRHTGQDAESIPPLFRKFSPHRAAKLEKLERTDPEGFRNASRHLARKMHEMERMRLADAEEFNRRIIIMRLEDKVAKTADEMRAAQERAAEARLKRELLADLEELFDRKEEAQRARLSRMERDLQELKDQLEERRHKRAELIKKRIEELTGEKPPEF